MKDKIEFSEFLEIEKKLEIRIGIINKVERIPKSFGLKLTVGFGEDETKTAFTNLGKTHEPEDLEGLTCPFVMNLEPSEMKGVMSEVMILVGDLNGDLEVNPSNYKPGSKLL